MRCTDLTKDQSGAIYRRLLPTLGYLNRMLARVDAERFPHDDPSQTYVVRKRGGCCGV